MRCLVSCVALAQSGDTQTRHPIVLVHGLLGFDSVLGVYWYSIGDGLHAALTKPTIGECARAKRPG
jgi:triacylglycerol lipase